MARQKPAACPSLEFADGKPSADAWGLALSDLAAASGFRHVAWFYRDAVEYRAGIEEFVQAGERSGEPTLLAVPECQVRQYRTALTAAAGSFVDMRQLGRNPARIMSAIRSFADDHAGQPVRFLGEPAWPERAAAELREVARHEAMLNLAFAEADITILCPYNAADLPSAAVSAARRTHPRLRVSGRESESASYRAPTDWPDGFAALLPAPPSARTLAYERDLRPVRALVRAGAGDAGLAATRCTDLVIAASEVAANTLKHTGGGGIIRVWATDDEVLCQLEDGGHITDPLAGYSRPAGDMVGRQGLWLVNQVCDLAEIRTSELGTTIRLHMYREPRSGSSAGVAQTGQGKVN
jgi:anti-sigma regulatory factor (Ser/Thr protein kinase)